jgi:DNA-binding NtrC family response regulator
LVLPINDSAKQRGCSFREKRWEVNAMSRVLVVDDDETIRDTVYEVLSEEYLCQTADTAEKAFARLEADTYDVVLTDISMPGLSGLELLGHIRQRFPDTPVIIISGISDQEHAQGLIRLGAFDFILKPFSLEAVEKSVKRAVEYRRRLRDGPLSEKAVSTGDGQTKESDEWKIVKKEPS